MGCGGGKEGKVGVRAGRKERVGGAGVERKVGVRVRLNLVEGVMRKKEKGLGGVGMN